MLFHFLHNVANQHLLMNIFFESIEFSKKV